MGTWVDFNGWISDAPVEVMKAIREELHEDLGIEVDDGGSMYYSDNCGYSWFERAQEAVQAAIVSRGLHGRATVGGGDDGTVDTWYFGTLDMRGRMEFQDIGHEIKSLQQRQEALRKEHGDAAIARWTLEGEVR